MEAIRHSRVRLHSLPGHSDRQAQVKGSRIYASCRCSNHLKETISATVWFSKIEAFQCDSHLQEVTEDVPPPKTGWYTNKMIWDRCPT